MAYLVVVALRSRCAQPPYTSSPAVIECWGVFPGAVSVHSISTFPSRFQCFEEKPQAEHGQVTHRRRTVRFAGCNDQNAGHVVRAISVFGSGLAIEGMFERAASVGHGDEVAEVRLRDVPRRGHTNASRSARRPSAKCRYSPATTDQPRLGASRDASAAILAASSGLVSTLLKRARHCIGVIVVDDKSGTT